MARGYSRFRFDPRKRYPDVDEEQGAAQLDSDGNLYTLLRRLIDYVEASINAGMQWAGFEPNDRERWWKRLARRR